MKLKCDDAVPADALILASRSTDPALSSAAVKEQGLVRRGGKGKGTKGA